MRLSRRFALILVGPPLIVLLPLALWFLATVLRLSGADALRLTLIAATSYAIGAIAFAWSVSERIARLDTDIAAGGDLSRDVSEALGLAELSALIFWVGWGMLLAAAGAAVLMPTSSGLQYFLEAALIIAAPAMAWSYWAGKQMLVGAVPPSAALAYHGRTYSVGVKIAMVFIGFFVVSAGALVLLVSSHVGERLRVAGIDGEAIAADVLRYGLLIAALTAIVFAAATYFLARDVTSPMTELIRVSSEMADGRFDTEPRIFSDDEMGRLAESFGVTRANLRTLIARVGSSGSAVTAGVRLMSGGTENLLSGAREQDRLTEESAVAVDQVRSEARSVLEAADTVTELTFDSAGRATELTASSIEVAKRMDELFQSVEKSSSATLELEASAGEMSNRTMRLAGIGSDVLVFVTEMDASVEAITKTAAATADLSTEVRNNALAGRAAVDATVNGIRVAQESTQRTAGAFDALQQSLGQIDKILLFIDELTNRTNLLSLNAAIIAAQAGQNDFGFSVIADEVRELAERTRSATKEIAAIIRNVQPITRQAVDALSEGVTSVDRTVELAHDASEALETILSSADQSLEMARSISSAMKEQTQASRHLRDVTTSVSETIAEIHRSTESQAEATRMMAQEAERVRDIALQVKRATNEQTLSGGGIANAMEQIAGDIKLIRDRLQRQLEHAEQIAGASRVTLSIARRNSSIAEEFTQALTSINQSGQGFEEEVARFKV